MPGAARDPVSAGPLAPPAADPQLAWAAELLARRGMRAWADTGTLLGLVREGAPLAHDGDLDLSIWDHDLPALEEATREAVREGYRLSRWRHRGRTFKLKLTPARTSAGRVLDFKVYRRHDGSAWCPQVFEREFRARAAWLLARTTRRALLRWTGDRPVDRFPWRALWGANLWWIPARLFDALEAWRGTSVLVPAAAEEYLRLHYGDWRRPDPSWDTLRQDGAIRREPPEVLER